jgi:hypothetical protein
MSPKPAEAAADLMGVGHPNTDATRGVDRRRLMGSGG